jgi:hypothetical protein
MNAKEYMNQIKSAVAELTPLEAAVMTAITKDDFYTGLDSVIWSSEFSMPNMNQARGAMASLVKKGYLNVSDTIGYTEKGKSWMNRTGWATIKIREDIEEI